jgi:hypothetical protein
MNTTITYKSKETKTKKGYLWLITVIDYMKEGKYLDFLKK